MATAPPVVNNGQKYMDFKFLNDPDTIEYIHHSKVMIILKGLSGSGKSTVAEAILKIYPDASVCSADHFLIRKGKYSFNPSLLNEAHEQCQRKAAVATEKEVPVIVIDNTNVRYWETKFYLDLAAAAGYICFVVETQTPWRFNSRKLAGKSSHNVSEDVLQEKVKCYENPHPLFFGWFLNHADSLLLHEMAEQLLQQLAKLPDFIEKFKLFTHLDGQDIVGYYSRDNCSHSSKILHCTANYLGRNVNIKGQQYIQNVSECVGNVMNIEVIGFLVSVRCICARIRLTSDQLQLWGSDMDVDDVNDVLQSLSLTGATKGRGGDVTGLNGGRGVGQTRGNGRGNFKSIDSGQKFSNRSTLAAESVTSHLVKPSSAMHMFQPTMTKKPMPSPEELQYQAISVMGRRAHITLGCATGFPAKVAGIDLLKALEKVEHSNMRCKDPLGEMENTFKLQDGMTVRYLDGRFLADLFTKEHHHEKFVWCCLLRILIIMSTVVVWLQFLSYAKCTFLIFVLTAFYNISTNIIYTGNFNCLEHCTCDAI